MAAPAAFVSGGFKLPCGRARETFGAVDARPRGAATGARSLSMVAKDVTFGLAARAALVAGIDAVANAVKVTLGPKGRNVVLQGTGGAPQVVNDGVTIARDIEFADERVNTGVKLLQEVASRTDMKAGDGTTTSTVLCQEFVLQGMKAVAAGQNPMGMRRGIDKAVAAVLGEVKRRAKPLRGREDIRSVATISAGNDEAMGQVITRAYERIGDMGATSVEESRGVADEIHFTEGLELGRGFLSPYFVTDQERQLADMVQPRVLVTDRKLSSVQEIVRVLEQIAKSKEPLFIICDDIAGEALSTLIVNKVRGILNVCAVKNPGFGESRKTYLEDIAVLTGAKYIAEDLGVSLESVRLEDLGYAERVLASQDASTLVATGKYEEQVRDRIRRIRDEMENTDSSYEREQGSERIARLSGGVARIMVGAATETELKDRMLRYEDALNATRAAIETGIVPGGGATLLHCASVIPPLLAEMEDEDELIGAKIVLRSLEAPIRQIAHNAGMEGDLVVEEVGELEFGFGFNAKTMEYENLLETGIVDPAKVTMWALENAASVASLVLTTECLVVDAEAPPKAAPQTESDYL